MSPPLCGEGLRQETASWALPKFYSWLRSRPAVVQDRLASFGSGIILAESLTSKLLVIFQPGQRKNLSKLLDMG